MPRSFARLFQAAGRIDLCIKELQVAVKLDPEDPGLRVEFGQAWEAAGNLPSAIREYRAALALDKNHVAAHYSLANALEKSHLTLEAKAAWQHYVQIATGNPREASRLAVGLAHLQQLK